MSGWSPHLTQIEIHLLNACSRPEPDMVEQALDAGARVHVSDGEGMNPLHVLAQGLMADGPRAERAARFESCARLLVRAGIDPSASMADGSGRTSAKIAAVEAAAARWGGALNGDLQTLRAVAESLDLRDELRRSAPTQASGGAPRL